MKKKNYQIKESETFTTFIYTPSTSSDNNNQSTNNTENISFNESVTSSNLELHKNETNLNKKFKLNNFNKSVSDSIESECLEHYEHNLEKYKGKFCAKKNFFIYFVEFFK